MADFVNGNATDTKYEHLEDDGWQMSIDGSCHHLTGMVEMLALRHRLTQYVLAVPLHGRQEPD